MHRVAHTFSCTLLSGKRNLFQIKHTLLCFRFQHVKDRFRDSESLRAEHRGNDPRNWPLYFQCPCRHIRHDLYMIHKQSVDKEQSKSTRGHRTSEKKKLQSLFSFSNSEQHGHPYIFISFLQGAPERRCSFFLLDLR